MAGTVNNKDKPKPSVAIFVYRGLDYLVLFKSSALWIHDSTWKIFLIGKNMFVEQSLKTHKH